MSHALLNFDVSLSGRRHSLFLHFLFIQELLKRVKGYGGRFLKRGDDELWYEIDDADARYKARAGKSPVWLFIAVNMMCGTTAENMMSTTHSTR